MRFTSPLPFLFFIDQPKWCFIGTTFVVKMMLKSAKESKNAPLSDSFDEIKVVSGVRERFTVYSF
jgi:hypothetical protein